MRGEASHAHHSRLQTLTATPYEPETAANTLVRDQRSTILGLTDASVGEQALA